MIVVSGEADIRNYRQLAVHISENTSLPGDVMFYRGPMDVLDHSSDAFSFGGKMGIDATIKMEEERNGMHNLTGMSKEKFSGTAGLFLKDRLVKGYNLDLIRNGIPVIILSVNRSEDSDIILKVRDLFKKNDPEGAAKLILVTDHSVDTGNLHMVAWQVLGNSDPQRDHIFISESSILIDATIKAFRKGGFSRRWPNVVCSDERTIKAVNEKWESLGIGGFIGSPSEIYRKLLVGNGEETSVK
jgi:4-hydroxy-3-polyprenylbenzoate decarboxylase